MSNDKRGTYQTSDLRDPTSNSCSTYYVRVCVAHIKLLLVPVRSVQSLCVLVSAPLLESHNGIVTLRNILLPAMAIDGYISRPGVVDRQ